MKKIKPFLTGFLAGLILVSAIIIGVGCSRGQAYSEAELTEYGPEYDSVVIARIDDNEITLADLLSNPQIYMLLDQYIITPEITLIEAAELGVSVPQEEIEEQYNNFLDTNGGWDAFIENMVPPMIPEELIPDDLKRNFLVQSLQEKIIEKLWEIEHGEVTDAEIEEFWVTNGEAYRNYLAGLAEVDPEELTMEQSTEYIAEEIKRQWISERQMTYMEEMRENHEIEILLLDRLNIVELAEDVDVPVVTEETFEGQVVEGHGEDHGDGEHAAEETGEGEHEEGMDGEEEAETGYDEDPVGEESETEHHGE